MKQSSKKYVTLVSEDSTVGTISWGDMDNIQVSDDNYAKATCQDGEQTKYIKATDFDFDIGTDMRITGIRVGIEHKNTINRDNSDRIVYLKLVRNDTIQAHVKSNTTNISGSNSGQELTQTFGDSTDLWGEAEFPLSVVNKDDFGVVISFKKS